MTSETLVLETKDLHDAWGRWVTNTLNPI